MAEISATLFYKPNRFFSMGSITFDLLLSEDHSFSNTVTEHRVENGSTISDHIKSELREGGLSGLISNFSVNTEGVISNRAQDAFDELKRLMTAGELVTIVLLLDVYEDVAVTSVSIGKSSGSGEAIILNASFKQVKKVKLEEVTVDVSVNVSDMSNDLNRQSANSADIGRTVGQ